MRYAITGLLPFLAPAAGGLFLLLVAATPARAGITPGEDALEVLNCNDSGPGSLREAVALAPSGAVIDLTGLACRRIDLTSGAIAVPQDDLALVGRGISAIAVDGGLTASVLRHSGTGRLTLQGLTVQRGYHRDEINLAYGGCVYSEGAVKLEHARVRWCRARGGAQISSGGGIYAEGPVTLLHSQVLGNTALYSAAIQTRGRLQVHHSWICSNRARSGGVATAHGLRATYSTFSRNHGGVLYVFGDALIANSTISGNGGVDSQMLYVAPERATGTGGSAQIINSTISGNDSLHMTVVFDGWPNSIVNSTIAFNRHRSIRDYGGCPESGTILLIRQQAPLHMDSSIIANNTCDDEPHRNIIAAEPYHPAVEGADNLVTRSGVPLPPDTLRSDPLLEALAANGGPTRTHALSAGSPAVDSGNNFAALSYDQRGRGYPRVRGPRADIGAYER